MWATAQADRISDQNPDMDVSGTVFSGQLDRMCRRTLQKPSHSQKANQGFLCWTQLSNTYQNATGCPQIDPWSLRTICKVLITNQVCPCLLLDRLVSYLRTKSANDPDKAVMHERLSDP